MGTHAVRYIEIQSHLVGSFWPRIIPQSGSNLGIWDPRGLGAGNEATYKTDNGKSVTVDVLGLQWYAPGTTFRVSCDVKDGADLENENVFEITDNGVTAHFTAKGALGTASLVYPAE